MNDHLRRLTLLLTALFCLLAGITTAQPEPTRPEPAPPSTHAYRINQSLGRGINFGNTLDAPSLGAWGLDYHPWMFDVAQRAGFDSVRLPVRWSAHADEHRPYRVSPAIFKLVDDAIREARRRGMPVVLNTHHYDEIFEDPAAHEDRLVSIWQQVAARYRSVPDELLVFELLNEPHNELTPERWNELLPRLVETVRKQNPTRPVMIGPGNYNSIAALDKLELPSDDHLIVSVHFYNPFEFTHQGAEWVGPRSNDWLGREWTGSDDERAELRKSFERAAAWAVEKGVPLNVGEFGAYSKADTASRARWTRAVRDLCEELGMSWHYWELAAGFGVWNPSQQRFNEEIKQALLGEGPLPDSPPSPAEAP
ncbi:MAG: glycoside hydrolase family 5 protein [Planctomycetota bacterium]